MVFVIMLNEQYDNLQELLYKCKTKVELKEALRPYVKKICHSYIDIIFSPYTVDSMKNEIYTFEQLVHHISALDMATIDKIVKDILREQ